MATVRLNQPYEAGTYHDQYNVGGKSIIIQPWYIDPEGNFTQDEYTLVYRGNSGRRGFGSLDNLFINRIRQLAKIWRDEISSYEKDLWKNQAATKDAARPNMEGPATTGWNLFAMTAMAPVMLNADPRAYNDSSYVQFPTLTTFDSADSATQQLTFSLTYAADEFVVHTNFDLIHQVHPKHIGKRDAARRTLCVGYYHSLFPLPRNQTFSVQGIYPFEAGDQVACLVRHHAASFGVRNLLLDVVAA